MRIAGGIIPQQAENKRIPNTHLAHSQCAPGVRLVWVRCALGVRLTRSVSLAVLTLRRLRLP